MYAKWEEIEEQIRLAAESVLTDHDPTEGPLDPSQVEWALETAGRIAYETMEKLDGYELEDM